MKRGRVMSNRSGQATIGLIGLAFILFLFVVLVFFQIPIDTAFIIILGTVIFAVSFINTDIALIILIFSMLLSPEFHAGGDVVGRTVKIRADDVFIIVIFIGWFAKMAVNKELGLFKSTALNVPIGAYSLICLLASFFAILQGRIDFKSSVFYMLKYLEYFLLYFLVANNLKTREQAKKYMKFLFLTCALVCLYGLLFSHGAERVRGPFETEAGEPNTFAGYLIFMMALAMGFLLNLRSANKKPFLLVPLGLAGVTFLLTLSRSGWISFFPMFLVIILLSKKARAGLVIIFITGAILVPILAPSQVHKRVQDTFSGPKLYQMMGKKFAIDESGQARIDSWQIGFQRWIARPVFGYGIPAGAVIDNQYTRVLNETGVIGIAVFFWMLFTIFHVVWMVRRTMPEDDLAQSLTVGFLAGFAGLLLLSSSAAVFIIIKIMEPFWFVLAIIAALPSVPDSEKV